MGAMQKKMKLRREGRSVFLVAASVGMILAASPFFASEVNIPQLTAKERLKAVLNGFDRAQENTKTLIAAFQETKTLQLLTDPVESSGYFYFSKPNRVKWEYREPETKVYLLTEDSYTAYYPEQKRAEKVNVRHYSAKLFRAFGIGQTTSELKKYYDIHLADSSDRENTFLLVLLPKKRRIQKRIETLRIWVDDQSFLPVQMEYLEPDGDSTLLGFDRILINQEIQASRYQIKIPSDVTVTDYFSGIGGIGKQQTN